MESTKFQYIEFNLIMKGKKTNVYACYNIKRGAILGVVKWHGAWRQYCFYPKGETIFNKKCLSNVIEFIDTLMQERKNGNNRRNDR